MAFVPEGHHDSSQARSAWIMENRPCLSGTVEVIVSSTFLTAASNRYLRPIRVKRKFSQE
jgi:hypothetical protein